MERQGERGRLRDMGGVSMYIWMKREMNEETHQR